MPQSNEPKIEIRHTSILIRDYSIGDAPQLEKQLSVFDPIRHRYKHKGLMWSENDKILRIPRGFDLNFLEKVFNTQAVMNYKSDPYDEVSIQAKVPPKDNIQREAVAFLIGAEKYKYTSKYSQQLIQLPPGSGKTYIMTTSLQFIRRRVFIIVPNEKIKKQHILSLLKFTNLTKDDIIDVRSKSVINKIHRRSDPRWKVYIACHGTLISHAKRNGWDSITNLFNHCKIGVKIYDEAHLFFENILKIDFHTNTAKTIYMTATFKRSDYNENILFQKCFRNVVTFGLDLEEKYRRHIMYLGLLYNSKPSIDEQSHVITKMGFSKIRYCNYQMKQDKFFDALDYAIKYFKRFEGKILVLITTIEGVETVKKFIDDNYDDLSVSSFHSKSTGEMKDKAFEADIICTTPQSAGTGADIPGLRVCIMCESYASTVEAEQVSGRLREYSESDDTYYVELVDVGFPRVNNMWKKRLPVFKRKCKKLLSLDLSTKKDETKKDFEKVDMSNYF